MTNATTKAELKRKILVLEAEVDRVRGDFLRRCDLHQRDLTRLSLQVDTWKRHALAVGAALDQILQADKVEPRR